MADMASVNTDDICVDFGQICRVCLKNCGKMFALKGHPSEYYDLGGMSLETKDLSSKLAALTGIGVTADDTFPLWMCSNCVRKLNEATDFIHMWAESQATLEKSFIEELLKIGFTNDRVQEILTSRGLKTTAVPIDEEADNLVSEASSDSPSTDESATCFDCCKLFSTEDELAIHRISVHHDDLVGSKHPVNLLTCQLCKASLHTKAAMSFHMKCHAASFQRNRAGTFQTSACRYCGEQDWGGDWNAHLKTAHRVTKLQSPSTTSFDCKICLRPFMRHCGLRSHIERHHADHLEEMAESEGCVILWNCKDCETSFADEAELLVHCESMHGKRVTDVSAMRALQLRTDTCVCGYVSTSPLEDSVHDVFLHPELALKDSCPACEESLTGSEELKNHLVLNHYFLSIGLGESCVLCNASFKNFKSIRRHMEKVHGLSSVPRERSICDNVSFSQTDASRNILDVQMELVGCNTCGCYFESEKVLAEHDCAEAWTTNRPTCPLCSKVFSSKMNLHNHYKRRHLQIAKRYVCSYCGKSLKGPVTLRSHEERLHRGLRRFPCPDCPMAFTTASILRKHSEQHMAVRPMHCCPHCSRQFSTVSGFSRHVQTHEGTKNFVCQMEPCRKAFYTAVELRRHTRFHTQDLDHECGTCGRKFLSPGELRKHQTKHTSDQYVKQKQTWSISQTR